MPYIIDGHNLIPKITGIDLRNIDDEEQLIQQLLAFAQCSGKKIEVFFDKAPPGQARRQSYGKVMAYFVREGRTADEAISARLRALGGGARNWTVISSDREVQAEARACHARVVSSQAFAEQLITLSSATPPIPGKKVSPEVNNKEVEYWLKQFSEE